jgi:hypothetical protein
MTENRYILSTYPHRFAWRWDKGRNWLVVVGSHCAADVIAVRAMTRSRAIFTGIEAVIHTAPDGVVSIYRGRRLELVTQNQAV